MPLVALVASHHNRDLALVEQLSVGAHLAGKAITGSRDVVNGAVVLPTCNRFEVYVDADNFDSARAHVVAQLSTLTSLPIAVISDALTGLDLDDAAHHLMSVATGLESMVVGEAEISGQVRRAYTDAKSAGHVSPVLDRLFQAALHTSKIVAADTGLGTSGRSVASVALDLAEDHVSWERASVLIVGTGALSEAAVTALRVRGASLTAVYSPSGRGSQFAQHHGVRLLSADELRESVASVDVVLACSGGDSVVLTPTLVAAARSGATSPLTIIDLALHRDVAPGVAELEGVTVINLESVGAAAPTESESAVEAARSIVARSVARFGDGESLRALDPETLALRERVFALLDREIARARPAAGASPSEQQAADATERSLRHFARTLLHTPTVAQSDDGSHLDPQEPVSAVQALYGQDVAAHLQAVVRGG